MSSRSDPGGRRDAFSRASFANFISRSCNDSDCFERRRLNTLSSLIAQAVAQRVSQPPAPTASLVVIQNNTVVSGRFPSTFRERHDASGIDSLLPGRQAGEAMAVPARVSASVRGRFAFRYRNHRHPPQFEWWVTDGFRIRVERDGDRLRLITRGGYDWTKRLG